LKKRGWPKRPNRTMFRTFKATVYVILQPPHLRRNADPSLRAAGGIIPGAREQGVLAPRQHSAVDRAAHGGVRRLSGHGSPGDRASGRGGIAISAARAGNIRDEQGRAAPEAARRDD